MKLRTFFAGVVCALASAGAAAQGAADYPAKSIQFVICYAPGGGVDVVGRIVGERLTKALGKQVVVENRPGAGGNIGTSYVAKAAPDGYTLLGTPNSFNINPLIYKNAGYDPRRDLSLIHI